MKTLLCLLTFFTLTLSAATDTGSVTIPDTKVAAMSTLVEIWIQGQLEADGVTLKYPGADVAARRGALMDSILREGMRDVVIQACTQFPVSCEASIKGKMEDKATADTGITTEVNNLIQ